MREGIILAVYGYKAVMGAREVTSQITVSDHAAPVAGSAPLLLDSRVAARAVGRDESLGEAAR